MDASQLSFGEGVAAGLLQSLDPELIGQRLADKVRPPKLTRVANVGDQEISTDSRGSFFLDGLRQREMPRDLLNLADRETNIQRQAASDKRAESGERRAQAGEQRAQARFGMETVADAMNIQQRMEAQSFKHEEWEHTRRTWANEDATQKAERAAFAPLNQQYAQQRFAGAQRLGAQIDPAIADSLSAAAEIMPPDKFKAVADSMFTAAMTGQDTSGLSQEIMEGYATTLEAQGKARATIASGDTKEALRELKELQDSKDTVRLAEATAKLRTRQAFEQVAIMRDAMRWQPGLPRSLTQYDQVIAAGNPSSSRVEAYFRLAMQHFEALHGRTPMSQEDGMVVKEIAEQMSAEDGWQP